MSQFITPLEPRRLMATTFTSIAEVKESHVLIITGTPKNDSINLYSIKDSYALEIGGKVKIAYKKKDINQVIIWGLAGNDSLRFNGTAPVLLIGGDGRDTLTGGKGNDIIDGGPGNDRLNGGKGNDVLRGDSGNDSLYGSDGDDLIYGGADTVSASGKLAINSVDGGKGTNTYISSANADETRGIKLKSITGPFKPETYRPTDTNTYSAFPESIASLSPTVGDDTGADNTTKQFYFALNIQAALPADQNVADHLLFSPPVFKGTNYQVGAIFLSVPTSEPVSTLNNSPAVIDLPNRTGSYTFQLNEPGGLFPTTAIPITITNPTT